MKKEMILLAGLLAGQAFAGELPSDSIRVCQLNEVSVSAVQIGKETPMAFSDIKAEQLQENNTGQSLPYLFAGSPSVILTSDGGNGIGYASFRVRGTDANRINFTVDGVPLNDMESHGVFWVNMPDFASSIDNVQIQRGAGSSTNGAGAFGATVSMNTEKPSLSPYAEVQTSAGSYATFTNMVKAGTGLLDNGFAFDVRMSQVQTDGYIERAAVNMKSYFASAAYYLDQTMFRFKTFGSSEVSYQAWDGADKEQLKINRRHNNCGAYTDENGDLRYYGNQTDNYWQHHYHLLATHRFDERWDASVTLHYTDGRGYYEDYKEDAKYAAYKLPNYVDASGATHKRTDMVRRKWLDNDFYGGIFRLNYHHNHLSANLGGGWNRYVGDHFGRLMWTKTAEALPNPDYEYYRNQAIKRDANVYAKANYRFLNHFDAYLDLQYRHIHYTIDGEDDKAGEVHLSEDYPFFNPKAGLHYGQNGHDAYASFSVAHREPNRDNFLESPNQYPTFETLYDWEVGYSYRSDRWSTEANLYYMDYDNQLILTGKISDIGETLTENIKDSYRMGVELSAGVKLTPWLTWQGNTTLSRNKIRHFVEYVDAFDADWNDLPQVINPYEETDIAFSPDFMANSLFDVKLGAFSAAFSSSYVGRQYLDNTASKDRCIDPYFVNNLRLGYRFQPKFAREVRLDLCLNNLFNEEYESSGWVWSYFLDGQRQQECGYFAQAGFNVMTKLTLCF